jgi:coenzyme F420-dependent glucose-6-phosphate dehydrogenase
MAPGRFYLGVGTGAALNEYSATGRWPGFKTRQEQMVEAIELIRALWTGETVSHQGAHYQTRRARLYTRPPRPIPLYVSSMAPNSARLAGKCGDGLITVGGREPDLYREIIENFEAGARDAGKNPATMSRMIELGVAYTDDEEMAIEYRKAYWAGTFVPALFTERIYTPTMSEENGRVVGSDRIRQSTCISADPADHIELARRYIGLGFDHLIFHSAGPDQRAFLEGYGRDVLPGLRQDPSDFRSANRNSG